jgi:tetratricopeptide (TPR) repeat protein
MKKLLPALALLFFAGANAQLTSTPSGGNKKASVGERIGITDVTIHYDRPGVKGRDGKIWGQLIQPGFNDLGFGNTKQAPWRAGANENTTIEFSTAVKVEGQDLPAGKYAFFVAYSADECTLIFSKNNNSWGSFYYNPAEDALRVKVKPIGLANSVEWLKYEFTAETPNSAMVALEWEKLEIPFKVEVDLATTQLASFRQELQTDKGFSWEAWAQAAQWCVDNNTNLDQALAWADTAVSVNFGGDRSFQAWSTKAIVLDKLGRAAEATDVMKKALPFGGEFDVHQYARKLLAGKRYQDAFDVFKLNYDSHPGLFVTTFGLARGYSGLGKYKDALKYALLAQAIVPDPANKTIVESAIEKLKEGKDFN